MKIKAVIGMMVLIMSTSLINTVSFAEDNSVETTAQTSESTDTIQDEQQVNDDASDAEIPVIIEENEASNTQENSEVEDGIEEQTKEPVELNLNFEEFSTELLEALNIREKDVEVFQTGSDIIAVMESARQIAQAEYDLLVQYYIPDDTTRPAEGNVAINRWLLQKCYMEGLKLQSTAPTDNEQAFVDAWEKGCQYRIFALKEMNLEPKLYEDGNIPDFSVAVLDVSETDDYEENSYLAYMVQALLGINVDGEFGNGSRVSLKDYQLSHDLVPNAILDEKVVTSLMETMETTELDRARETLNGLSANNQLGITANVVEDIIDSFDTYRSNLAQ